MKKMYIIFVILTISIFYGCKPTVPITPVVVDAPEILPVLGFTGNLARSMTSRSLMMDMTSPDNYLATLVVDNEWSTLADEASYVEGTLGMYISFCPALGGFVSNTAQIGFDDAYTTSYLGYDIPFEIKKVDGKIHYDATFPAESGYISIIYDPATRNVVYTQTLLMDISYGTSRPSFMHFNFTGTVGTDNSIHFKSDGAFIVTDGTMKVLQDFEFYSAADYQGFYTSGFLENLDGEVLELSVANEATLIELSEDTASFDPVPYTLYIYMDKTGDAPVPVVGPETDTVGSMYRADITPPWTLLD